MSEPSGMSNDELDGVDLGFLYLGMNDSFSSDGVSDDGASNDDAGDITDDTMDIPDAYDDDDDDVFSMQQLPSDEDFPDDMSGDFPGDESLPPDLPPDMMGVDELLDVDVVDVDKPDNDGSELYDEGFDDESDDVSDEDGEDTSDDYFSVTSSMGPSSMPSSSDITDDSMSIYGDNSKTTYVSPVSSSSDSSFFDDDDYVDFDPSSDFTPDEYQEQEARHSSRPLPSSPIAGDNDYVSWNQQKETIPRQVESYVGHNINSMGVSSTGTTPGTLTDDQRALYGDRGRTQQNIMSDMESMFRSFKKDLLDDVKKIVSGRGDRIVQNTSQFTPRRGSVDAAINTAQGYVDRADTFDSSMFSRALTSPHFHSPETKTQKSISIGSPYAHKAEQVPGVGSGVDRSRTHVGDTPDDLVYSADKLFSSQMPQRSDNGSIRGTSVSRSGFSSTSGGYMKQENNSSRAFDPNGPYSPEGAYDARSSSRTPPAYSAGAYRRDTQERNAQYRDLHSRDPHSRDLQGGDSDSYRHPQVNNYPTQPDYLQNDPNILHSRDVPVSEYRAGDYRSVGLQAYNSQESFDGFGYVSRERYKELESELEFVIRDRDRYQQSATKYRGELVDVQKKVAQLTEENRRLLADNQAMYNDIMAMRRYGR